MTNDTPKDFVVSQQRLLLSAWSLDDDLWENWEDHRATLEKALKALATGRQREIKSHLNGPMATQLGDQLELLQEEHVDHKTRQQAQAGEVGKLAVGTEEPGWYHSLIEEWPNAHPKAQGQRYKDLLARVKKLEKTKTSLTEQAQVYRTLNRQIEINPESIRGQMAVDNGPLNDKLQTLIHLINQTEGPDHGD